MNRRAENAEGAIAKLLAGLAGQLVDLQQHVQPDDVDELRALMTASSAVRLTIEVPRVGVDVPATVTVSIIDVTGGERDVRHLTLATDTTGRHGLAN